MKKKTIIFLCLLIISSLLVGGLGTFLKSSLLEPLGIHRQEHPVALPFVLMEDEMLQAEIQMGLEELQNPPTEPPVTEPPATESPVTIPEEVTTEPVTEPETTEPPKPVEDSWFDDALFIGESRIQGMQAFSRLGDADYFCGASMTVFGVMDAKLTDMRYIDATLNHVLATKTYGKILIHLGINELPMGAERIMKGYQKVIDYVRQRQPDAVIILIGCMSITEGYADNTGFDTQVVHELNGKLLALSEAEPEIYRYVDTNSWAAGEDGFLRPELTKDGCHLYGEYYADWCELIKQEAGKWDIP
jgi:hypothetical protein